MKKEIFGTREWAKYSANSTIGCSHNCRYCYAKASYEKKDIDIPWEQERTNFNYINYNWTKKDGVIMFPTQHDISPNNIEDVVTVLKNILSVGNNVLIVSKAHLDCTKRLCEEFNEYKDNILFRFTIGSTDNNVLSYWEPGAPLFEERFNSLKFAYEEGFNTSVSCEPLLDNEINKCINLVSLLEPYITNSIWIGKMNKIESRVFDIDSSILENFEIYQTDENIFNIYNSLKNNYKVKWKESIKKIVGLDLVTQSGLDI
jgi:DNA repair photolyase